MSSGGAEIIGELLKIPVARELTVAVCWWFSLQYALAGGGMELLVFATIVGAMVLGLVYWNHHRSKRNSEGGGGVLLLVVAMMFVALPLLIIAWRRRKATGG